MENGILLSSATTGLYSLQCAELAISGVAQAWTYIATLVEAFVQRGQISLHHSCHRTDDCTLDVTEDERGRESFPTLQPATANSLQVPGTPFRSHSPRSSNSKPDPATSIGTAAETRTSPAPACDLGVSSTARRIPSQVDGFLSLQGWRATLLSQRPTPGPRTLHTSSSRPIVCLQAP